MDQTQKYGMCCAIWHHLYNLKNVKNTYGGVLILVKLQAIPAEACTILDAVPMP